MLSLGTGAGAVLEGLVVAIVTARRIDFLPTASVGAAKTSAPASQAVLGSWDPPSRSAQGPVLPLWSGRGDPPTDDEKRTIELAYQASSAEPRGNVRLLGGFLYGQVASLRSLEDPINVEGCPAEVVRDVGSVSD